MRCFRKRRVPATRLTRLTKLTASVGPLGDVGSVPCHDVVPPPLDGAAESAQLEGQLSVGEVADDLINPRRRGSGEAGNLFARAKCGGEAEGETGSAAQ